ncbi:squamous cell carcinoma antigen recognized by T-cells 3-like [Dreissena polymorpha]|uniref:RRM domain-containing protein n=1 Tax=Dreissena polymorpha TaxID=45954 RepID=A0A9D4N3M8_DREPO|nr:squamous cell carcinoma antigen recognized by T-cells 3-like [Dreissena polymorpha]KAH3887201.1 hypothetical protein DPMN_011217 [Dreissena polymorpha]
MAEMETESSTNDDFDTIEEEEEMSSSENSASDSNDNDEDDANESELNSKITDLKNQLLENPYHYDSHVECIKCARELGDLEVLRKARQGMCSLFPLSEDLWLPWLQDEVGLVSDDKSREEVTELFEKAVLDYLSVPIWLEYVQFSIGKMGQPNGMTAIRETFDRALTACGLHVTKGGNLWEAYREFENAILAGLMPAPGSVPTKEQEDKFTAQHDRVEALFRRQLSVPLQGLEETLQEYTDWLQEEPDKNVKLAYNKALVKLEKIRPYEAKLAAAEPPRLAEYEEYIQNETQEGDPARIQSLYERALQENCLNTLLWLKYTKYLDHQLRDSSLSMSVYKRAVRNCPWCAQLWQNYLLALERTDRPYEEVKSVFETSLVSGISQGSEYLLLWTTFLDYLRRKIKWNEEHQESLDLFRVSIEKAIVQLDGFGLEGDPNGILRQTWAIIEAGRDNVVKARQLWGEIMSSGRGNEAALWLENYRFERQYGDSKHCRKVLQRALNSVTDFPESVVDALINFERLEGSLEQYELAVSKCEAQMERINERREKEREINELKADKKGGKGGVKGKHKHVERSGRGAHTGYQKKPRDQQTQKKDWNNKQENNKPDTEIKPYKRKNEAAITEEFKAPLPVSAKVSQPPPAGFRGQTDTSVPENSSQDQQKGLGDGLKKSAPPPGYKRPREQTSPPPGYQADRQSEVEPPEKKAKSDVDPASKASENNTVFVSNLNYKIDEEQIKSFFKKCGEIEDIRLIKSFQGKSKGYGYVQFTDELAVSNALTYDRTPMEGRPMFVSKYESRGGQKTKADFKYATSLEKNKLFVKNLPFTCTEDVIRTMFSEHGEVRSVRLVTYRSGASKGLAYVEFADEHSASQALLKTDGLMVGEHEISVAISNPPSRGTPMGQREDNGYVPTLGGGKKETTSRGVARTQVMLMPRSVSKRPAGASLSQNSGASSNNSEQHTDNTTASMSNSDFRNMLLKK